MESFLTVVSGDSPRTDRSGEISTGTEAAGAIGGAAPHDGGPGASRRRANVKDMSAEQAQAHRRAQARARMRRYRRRAAVLNPREVAGTWPNFMLDPLAGRLQMQHMHGSTTSRSVACFVDLADHGAHGQDIGAVRRYVALRVRDASYAAVGPRVQVCAAAKARFPSDRGAC